MPSPNFIKLKITLILNNPARNSTIQRTLILSVICWWHSKCLVVTLRNIYNIHIQGVLTLLYDGNKIVTYLPTVGKLYFFTQCLMQKNFFSQGFTKVSFSDFFSFFLAAKNLFYFFETIEFSRKKLKAIQIQMVL